jgi:hypothetical protein
MSELWALAGHHTETATRSNDDRFVLIVVGEAVN